ncbi:hypothetical protein CPC08DRAFT_714372 [Agrocybe pediades]|nr:hypothetical protein CPC08DRAFT_714372 [Agrocybe pediades]
MVASTNADLYPPFQQTMLPEEGPQSSEDGSGLHSPVFGAPYPTHGDSFRYHHESLDIHSSTAPMLAPQYDYSQLDNSLVPNSSSARHASFSSHHYPLPPRNHLALDYAHPAPLPPSVNPRISPATQSIDFRYAERRLPGGSSHESYNRPSGNPPSLPIEADHRTPLVSSSAAPAPTENTPAAAESSTASRGTRKEVSSVVIACRQCRSRKIKCDSTRPQCNNCVRRSNDCQYDLVPKRRGPDKHPGTRQRTCKKRNSDGSAPPPPKRRRTAPAEDVSQQQPPPQQPQPSKVKENMSDAKRPSPTSRHQDRQTQDPHYPNLNQHPHSGQVPPQSPDDLRLPIDPHAQYKQEMPMPYRRPQYMYDQGSYTKSSYPRQLDVNTFQFPEIVHRKFPIPTSPTIETNQKLWWSRILHAHNLNDITAELTFLVNNTGHLLSFINLNFLIKQLFRDDLRLRIQPSFILAALAMAKLMKSSCVEGGAQGLRDSMVLAEDAHKAFSEALAFNWVDATLVEAALILALFESSAHPEHSSSRATTALLNLDSLIRNIELTTIDTDMQGVNRFAPNSVPVIYSGVAENEKRKCGCPSGEPIGPQTNNYNRPYVLSWDSNWSDSEIRDEEIRRLCWSALSLVSDYIAQREAFNEDTPAFFLADPANFGILFPGELLDRTWMYLRPPGDPITPKETVWALYCRSMLLWNFCNRFRQPSQEEERAEQASEAFEEAQVLEDSLNAHRCNLDTTLIYTTREYIHNTRLLVAQACRSFHGLQDPKTKPGPIFKRKQAEEWIRYQERIVERTIVVIQNLSSPLGTQLTRKPFRINWFINQLAICMILWTHDPTLDEALMLAKTLIIPIDVLNGLFPCPEIERRINSYRHQLIEACRSREIEPPNLPAYTVSAYLRP